jgi:hypothetical protein
VCLCVVVVVAGVVELGLLVVGVEDEPELLPPHPATATVTASVATSVSMAVSGVLLIGRAPVVIDVRGFGRSPYQAFPAATAAGRATPEPA